MDRYAGEGIPGFVGRAGLGRTRSGHRVWPADVKGRIVRESLRPGVRVCEVARKYGLRAQQVTVWRRAARSGRLALISDDEGGAFVPIEISDGAARKTLKRGSRSRSEKSSCACRAIRAPCALLRS